MLRRKILRKAVYDLGPYTPGHEWAGDVVEVGSGVTTMKPGYKAIGDCVMRCGHLEDLEHNGFRENKGLRAEDHTLNGPSTSGNKITAVRDVRLKIIEVRAKAK